MSGEFMAEEQKARMQAIKDSEFRAANDDGEPQQTSPESGLAASPPDVVRITVEDEEFGEDFTVKVSIPDLIAAVRAGVESGIIKGNAIEVHRLQADSALDAPLLQAPKPGTYLVIPVDVGSLTVDCPTCDGLGVDITKWESANERHVPCPDCDGSGLVSDGGSET